MTVDGWRLGFQPIAYHEEILSLVLRSRSIPTHGDHALLDAMDLLQLFLQLILQRGSSRRTQKGEKTGTGQGEIKAKIG